MLRGQFSQYAGGTARIYDSWKKVLSVNIVYINRT